MGVNNSFVCVDLGASSTRVASNDLAIYEVPNNATFVDVIEKVDVAVRRVDNNIHEDVIGNLDVEIQKVDGGKCEHFPCRVIMGDTADRYTSVCTRPSVLKNKADQKINYVSAVVAAAHQQLVYGGDSDVDMYVALPPLEVSYNKEVLAEKLVGTYRVKFNRLNREVTVKLNTVTCVEESFMALVDFFYELSGEPKVSAAPYVDGTVVSLDIGESTTDIVAAKNRGYVEKSGQTFKTGCGVIKAHISNVIRGKYGYDPTPEELSMVVETGRLAMGNGFVEMGETLRKAKQEFARSIVEQLQPYFRSVGIPLQTVKAIVVSGGGSMESAYTSMDGKRIMTCGPASEFITKELNEVVSGVDVLAVQGDPRTANIRGMLIFAMLNIVLKQKNNQAQ